MNTPKTTEPTAPAVASSAWLAEMQRCLLWMEHENRCAEREEKMGFWLTDHSEAMRQWDAEYMKAREAYVSANGGTQRGRDDDAPVATETQSRPSLK